eukprot:scaffold1499_cov170-Amphora_coffeaeformis.AAC.5
MGGRRRRLLPRRRKRGKRRAVEAPWLVPFYHKKERVKVWWEFWREKYICGELQTRMTCEEFKYDRRKDGSDGRRNHVICDHNVRFRRFGPFGPQGGEPFHNILLPVKTNASRLSLTLP